jgi:hypothetical protein
MQKSETIKELAAALAITQGQIQPAIKDSENPQFKGSKYADLRAIWDVVREPLSKNGLSVPQFVESSGEFVVITTMLLHKSGEWISSSLSLKPVKQDPQGYGSAATYGKRYGLAAILGVVADVDDDGNAATFGGNQPAKGVFANDALRKKFTQNVIDSFNQIDEHEEGALETLKTLSELNSEKIAELKASGNEHDGLAVDEIRKQYALKKQLIDQTKMLNEQMRTK